MKKAHGSRYLRVLRFLILAILDCGSSACSAGAWEIHTITRCRRGWPAAGWLLSCSPGWLGACGTRHRALNLKYVVAFRRGPSLAIPERAKPGIYARIRQVLAAPTLPLALLALALLSAAVNLVELLCTAALPAVYTRVLGTYELDRPAYYAYLLLRPGWLLGL